MKSQTLQLNLSQLAAIIAATGMLIIRPEFAVAVALFTGSIIALTMASSLLLGWYYSSNQINKLSEPHANMLGTYFGGLACYLVVICEAFKYLR